MISLVLRRWQLAFIIFAVVTFVLVVTKPSLMFRADGTPKHWGSVIDDTTSVFAPAFVFPALAFISYFVATVVELIAT
jgi:hypothetical protein